MGKHHKKHKKKSGTDAANVHPIIAKKNRVEITEFLNNLSLRIQEHLQEQSGGNLY